MTDANKNGPHLCVYSPMPSQGEVRRRITVAASCVDLGPVLLFPSEPNADVIATYWFPRKLDEPPGLPVISAHEGWRTVAALGNSDKPVIFYLRDCHYEVREIQYGFFHHAVYFDDWQEYDALVRSTEDVLTNFTVFLNAELEHWDFTGHGLPSGEKAPIYAKLRKALEDIRDDFLDWVKKHHPLRDRLLWVQSRLAAAENTLADVQAEHKRIQSG